MREIAYSLDRVSDICERFRISTLQGQLESIRSMLAREGIIDVAVLGRFKAGKSSFLNAVAGEAVLPVGVIPRTSKISQLTESKAPSPSISDSPNTDEHQPRPPTRTADRSSTPKPPPLNHRILFQIGA